MTLKIEFRKIVFFEKITAFLGLCLPPLINPFENYRKLRDFLQNISFTFEESNDRIDLTQPMNRKAKTNQTYNRCPVHHL